MDIIVILLLVVAAGAIYYGGTKFVQSLRSFLNVKITKTLPYSKLASQHVTWMALISVGVGLLGLSFIIHLNENLFLGFSYPFVASLSILWLVSAIQLKKKSDMPDTFHPMLSSTIILFLLPAIVFSFLTLEVIEPGLNYPLPKGIPFTGTPIVTFYAIFILSGAIVAYMLSEREFIKLGKKKGYVEDIFLVAFPAGILGARLWYVWGQWDLEFANRDFFHVFAIWEGGLAIMGGALGGALVGMLYVLVRRKDINLLQGLDFAVPTILVAQAIGRWGNFFNQEVFGNIADVNQWMWLPTFIREQMTITLNGVTAFRVPLFLIESMINLLGYFVIRYGVGLGLKKYTVPADQAFMYLVWYGLTRAIMEPLRNPFYNMGNDGNWSYLWGWIFFAAGLLAILVNHLIQRKRLRRA
jgi:prolipoprotein diacylglyceryl transferase